MGEILFKGKRIDNGKWIKSDSIMQIKGKNPRLWVEYEGWVEVIPETVGQYTGLCDENGTKIFEGDLIDDDVWSVAYCDGEGEFCGMQVGWYLQRDNWESYVALTNEVFLEVIGNIHDNNLEE